MTASDSNQTEPEGPSIEEVAKAATLSRLALDQAEDDGVEDGHSGEAPLPPS